LLHAQDTGKKVETVHFKVSGVCNECKVRIENAALMGGVKFAEWDKHSNELTVIYKNWKVAEREIHNAIAESGHDTEQVRATDEAYNNLPDCCAYRDGVETH
jgi:hypothetical protein